MAPNLSNVGIAGATGALGRHILAAFVATNQFNITVLTRDASKTTVPAGVAVREVNWYDPSSLAAAFAGLDAVVNATSQHDPKLAIAMVDAAAAAGVTRYIPPDFGQDPDNEFVATLGPYQGKTAVRRRLEALAAEGKMEWTVVANGCFLEWNLTTGFVGIDFASRTIQIFGDQGKTHVGPWSSFPDIGAATAQALLKPDETRNRTVYISSFDKSQRQLADLVKQALGGDWEETTIDIKAQYTHALEELKQGNFGWGVLAPIIQYAATAPEAGGPWAKNDNELLGMPQLSDDDIIDIIKKLAA